MDNALFGKIEKISDGNMGVYMALLATRETIGDTYLEKFLDKVVDKGGALWVRFKDFQKAGKEAGKEDSLLGFAHFIASHFTMDEVLG